jgi:hypothetical protein
MLLSTDGIGQRGHVCSEYTLRYLYAGQLTGRRERSLDMIGAADLWSSW